MRIEEYYENLFEKEAAFSEGTISNPNAIRIPIPGAIPADYGFSDEDEKPARQRSNIFSIQAMPAALIGAIIGGKIGKDQANKRDLRTAAPMPRPNSPTPIKSESGFEQFGYHKQMKQMIDNLKVIFTPISVVYAVKDGGREITLEAIDYDEMNEEMKDAWRTRNQSYFKNILLNKMQSEIQYAERMMAKKIIEKQMGISKAISKEASEKEDLDYEDLTDVEIIHYAQATHDFFEKESAVIEKVAEMIFNEMDDGEEYVLSESVLDSRFNKYAGAISDTLSLLTNRDDSSKYLNPTYLSMNLKVGFFPDRVIFSVKDKLVSTLLASEMSDEEFENFGERDSDFFKGYFKKRVRTGVARINAKYPKPYSPSQEKTAAIIQTVNDIFHENDIHPAVYFLALTAKYGYEWVDFDPVALIDMIEKDFALTRPIKDIPLNKIMAVKVANNGINAYTSRHGFEKVIRAINGKPVDFFERETSDMDLMDFVFGLETLDRVTPYDNIYDNFSPEVYDYMVKILASKENYAWCVNVTGTSEESQFITLLNYSLLNELNNRYTSDINSASERNVIIKENEAVFDSLISFYYLVQSELAKNPGTNPADYCKDLSQQAGITEKLRGIIVRQVIKNISLNNALDEKEQVLLKTLAGLGLYERK